MRTIGFIALTWLSCQPAPIASRIGRPSTHVPSAAPHSPPAAASTPPSSAHAPSASAAPTAPTASAVSSEPDDPEPIVLEFVIYDHRVSFAPHPVEGLILDHLSADLVVHTDPKQTLMIGSFQNQSCVVYPEDPPPSLPGLACVFDGPVGNATLVRVLGDLVRVDAIEGPDGAGTVGGTQHWTAGTVTIPEGAAVSASTVERDEQLRIGSKLPPLTIALLKHPRGARLEVGTTPPQRLIVSGWDPSNCQLQLQGIDMARIAFVECPAPQKDLLLAYVAHDLAEVWVFDGAPNFFDGPLRVVGRVKVPRDRPLDVTMTTAATPQP